MARYVDIECDAVTELIGRRAFKSRDDIQDFLDNIPTVKVVPINEYEAKRTEIELLKKELTEVVRKNEELEKKVKTLNQIFDDGKAIVEFQKGKIEAYEFAIRYGGKTNGNSCT